MGQNRDRGLLRENEEWARQVVGYRGRPGEHDRCTYIHQHAVPEGRGASGARKGMVKAFGAAATAAGSCGAIFLMVGHGSEEMVDLAPAPWLRVTEETIVAANQLAENRRVRRQREQSAGSETVRDPVPPLSYADEVESLLLLRDAIRGRFRRLDLATCNVGRGRGADLCGRLQRFFGIDQVRGLAGFFVERTCSAE